MRTRSVDRRTNELAIS